MDAVTYPSREAALWLRERLVPVRLPHDHDPLAEQFDIVRTPCLIFLDPQGTEVHRTVGVLSPDEFSSFVQLGTAKLLYRQGQWQPALERLEELLNKNPQSLSVAEAVFLRGRCLYRHTHSPIHLKDAHDQLRSKFPGSEWTRRTLQYRLL